MYFFILRSSVTPTKMLFESRRLKHGWLRVISVTAICYLVSIGVVIFYKSFYPSHMRIHTMSTQIFITRWPRQQPGNAWERNEARGLDGSRISKLKVPDRTLPYEKLGITCTRSVNQTRRANRMHPRY